MNVTYLLKIVDLCRQNKIRLILLNPPMQDYYLSSVPVSFKEKYYSLIRENNLDLIDFKKLSLNDTCYLPDGGHLSPCGTRPVTLYLKDILKGLPDLILKEH